MDLGRLRHLLLIAALVANRCSTQAQTRLPGDPAPAALPTAADWVLVVRATGGIAGIDHHATIDSTGAIACEGFRLRCANQLREESLERLNREIRQASPFRWSGAEAVGSDLLRRTVVLVIRVEADPSTSEFVAFWDIAPPEGAEDAGRLHELATQRARGAHAAECFRAVQGTSDRRIEIIGNREPQLLLDQLSGGPALD
jgi:hypothetical protein